MEEETTYDAKPKVGSIRKMYNIVYKVLESEHNPESVTDQLICAGIEAQDVVDAVDFYVTKVLAKGTVIDIFRVELAEIYENVEAEDGSIVAELKETTEIVHEVQNEHD